MGIYKSGKVVVVLAGRYAGKKAIIVKATDDGTKDRKFGHAIVAGIDRYPRRLVKAMGKAKIEKRSKIKPFVKTINYSHLMPTRYSVDFDLKKSMDETSLASDARVETRKALKKLFEEKYKVQSAKTDKKAVGVQYFYSKLRF